MDVLAHRNKAPVPDVKYPAVSVDLDASAADERSVFVFDDEILIVSEPFGDFDLGTAVMRSAASRRHDRTHDVVIPNQNCGSGRCARLVSGSRRRVSTVHSLDFLESCLQIVPSPVGREKVIAAGMSCRRALFD
jgi:hypothetical protein